MPDKNGNARKLSKQFKQNIPTPGPGAPEKVTKTFEYITRYLDEQELSVAKVKEECNIHSSGFSRIFKIYTGYLLRDFITHYRIELSKRFMDNGVSLNIGEIAHFTGYRSPDSFCNTFQNNTGYWPSERNNGNY